MVVCEGCVHGQLVYYTDEEELAACQHLNQEQQEVHGSETTALKHLVPMTELGTVPLRTSHHPAVPYELVDPVHSPGTGTDWQAGLEEEEPAVCDGWAQNEMGYDDVEELRAFQHQNRDPYQ